MNEYSRRQDDDMITRKFNLILNAIQRVGFPIVMSLILSSVLVYVLVWEIPKIKEANSNDVQKMVESLNKNTEAINSLKRFLTKRYD